MPIIVFVINKIFQCENKEIRISKVGGGGGAYSLFDDRYGELLHDMCLSIRDALLSLAQSLSLSLSLSFLLNSLNSLNMQNHV